MNLISAMQMVGSAFEILSEYGTGTFNSILLENRSIENLWE